MSEPVGPCYRYQAAVVSVHDGDTYHLSIDLGFYVSIVVPIRVRNINCPEQDTPEGKAATAAVKAILPPGEVVYVESYKNRRSFERWIADVYLANGTKLADLLVERGLAVVDVHR